MALKFCIASSVSLQTHTFWKADWEYKSFPPTSISHLVKAYFYEIYEHAFSIWVVPLMILSIKITNLIKKWYTSWMFNNLLWQLLRYMLFSWMVEETRGVEVTGPGSLCLVFPIGEIESNEGTELQLTEGKILCFACRSIFLINISSLNDIWNAKKNWIAIEKDKWNICHTDFIHCDENSWRDLTCISRETTWPLSILYSVLFENITKPKFDGITAKKYSK